MTRSRRAVRCLKRTPVYQGRVVTLVSELLEIGGVRMVRETILHPGSVVIVPILGRSRIVLVRQYRRAIDQDLLELPAGTLSPDEPPAACARRELEEETGWNAGRIRRIGAFYAAPGVSSEWMTMFLATDLTRTKARPEPDELLTPILLPLRTALAKVRSGEILDAKSIIGLLFAERLLGRKA